MTLKNINLHRFQTFGQVYKIQNEAIKYMNDFSVKGFHK